MAAKVFETGIISWKVVQSFPLKLYHLLHNLRKEEYIIEDLNVIQHKDNNLFSETAIVVLAAAAVFLPFIISGIVLISLAIYIIFKKQTRRLILIHEGSKVLFIFCAFAFFIAAIYKNWIGLLVAFGFTLAFVLGLYLRSVMTRILFERVLTMVCVQSLMGTVYALVEKFVFPYFNIGSRVNRASAMFFYPNYFGTIISMVIIICAYKVLTRQGKKWFYYFIASMNVISLYLCESMFAWVEIFLGVAVLLFLLKMHRLLAIWLLLATFASFIILVLNVNIIPRLYQAEVTTEIRFDIWDFAIKQIMKAPLLGHGFMSYMYTDADQHLGYLVPHSHSIILELLMDFGIVGTVLFLWYFVKYTITLVKTFINEKKTRITSLIFAISAAALVHGLADLTLMWIQTLPLFLFILAGLGAYEKKIETEVV
ncbi:O-antigen ligase family protein [Anaerocolumna aminovalerica]|uniref:O-antigen ligase family protein n=1 Tax=Anaerocolumna aminovalerica TaxID=1527 RepID=UPI00248B1B51|nr:O-antigen ligase family protein [Anaerocolumna aminovalerica]